MRHLLHESEHLQSFKSRSILIIFVQPLTSSCFLLCFRKLKRSTKTNLARRFSPVVSQECGRHPMFPHHSDGEALKLWWKFFRGTTLHSLRINNLLNVPQAIGNKWDKTRLHENNDWEKIFTSTESGKKIIFSARICETTAEEKFGCSINRTYSPKMAENKFQNTIIYTRPSSAI